MNNNSKQTDKLKFNNEKTNQTQVVEMVKKVDKHNLKEMVNIISNSELKENKNNANNDSTKQISLSTSKNEMIKVVDKTKPYTPIKLRDTQLNFSKDKISNNQFFRNQTNQNQNNIFKSLLNGDFKFKNGTLFYKGTPFFNFQIRIVEVIEGEYKSYYMCHVFVKNKIHKRKILVDNFLSGKWVYGIPGIAWKCDKRKATEYLCLYLGWLVDQLDVSSFVSQISKPGWKSVNEVYMYLTPNGAVGMPCVKIKSEYGQSLQGITNYKNGFVRYLRMINLTKNSCTAPILILYFTMSLCHTLYRDAGLTPKFLAFVYGERGSYKTALSLALTQLEHSESPLYNLKSTAAALEASFRHYKDAVLLVDDLAPTENTNYRKTLETNLELLVRMFGDATGKKRNKDYFSDDFYVEQYDVYGGLVVTGEYTTGCESSLARNLFLEVKKENIDLKLLTELQEERSILHQFVVSFIYGLTYLLNNNADVIGFIKSKGKQYREEKISQFSNSRYAEYRAQLLLASDLLMWVGRYFNYLTYSEIQYYSDIFKKAVEQVIHRNHNRLIEKSPLTLICNSILTTISNGNVAITHKDDKAPVNSKSILFDGKKIYISQDNCYYIYKNYVAFNNITVPEISSKTITKKLADAGIISVMYEGNDKRFTKKIKSVRFMEFDYDQLEKNSHLL